MKARSETVSVTLKAKIIKPCSRSLGPAMRHFTGAAQVYWNNGVTLALVAGAGTVLSATLPEFTLQSSDMLPTNRISMSTRPRTQYLARFVLTSDARARLQRFANSNLSEDVVINYGQNVTMTSKWWIADVAPTFTVFRPTRDEAIRLAASLGLARDWRVCLGRWSFGLLEISPGTTEIFSGPGRPVYTASISATQCLGVCAGGLLMLFVLTLLLRKRKSN